MGNRAVITTKENFKKNGIGIYVHWNGGRDSVEAFLRYCELKGYVSPEKCNYGFARLTQVISNLFGGHDSIGIDLLSNLDCDNRDNGVYIIEDWKIVDRKYFTNKREQHNYNLDEMLLLIDSKMPEDEQIKEYIEAKEVSTINLKPGDTIVDVNHDGKCYYSVVIGFIYKTNPDDTVERIPYTNRYGDDYINNRNNHITTKTVRIIKKEV